MYAAFRRLTLDLKTHRLKVRGWKMIFHGSGKKARVAILISDKIDIKMKTVTRDKARHYRMMKGSIQIEDITTVNILWTQHSSTSIYTANTNSHK